MEQIKRIQGDSVHLISVNGDKPLKLSQISTGGGGGTRPHYHGQTEFTPSTVTQTAQTEGLIVDSDITVNAMPIGSAKTPTVNVEANPTITMDGNGLVTASYSKTEAITPNVTAGYVASGTAGNVTFRGSSTYQLPSQAATAITPTESAQTAVAAGKYTTGAITVNAIPSNYIGSAVPSGSLSVSGSTITAASGFYPSAVSANVASGYLGATTVIAGQTASTHTFKVERQAATSGWYEASAVRNAGTVTLNNQSIGATPTESAQTFTPTNSVSYITQVTVNPIPSEYIVPSGTLSITSNASGIDVNTYAFADVAVPMPTPTLESKSVTLTPSTVSVASSVTYGAGYDGLSEVDITVDAVPTGSVQAKLTMVRSSNKITFNPTASVSQSGYIVASNYSGSATALNILHTTAFYPSTTTQVAGGQDMVLEGAINVFPVTTTNIEASYIASGVTVKVGTTNDDDSILAVTGTLDSGITPTGTITLSSNTTGVDVSQYAFADVAVPWTWMGEEPTVVNSSFYSDSYLLGSTSYNGWTGSTTAKVIVASASAGTFVASAMNEYEYLINWQMDVACTLKSTATKKATPIREVANVWQLITRRPNSVTNITNDNFNGNTAYTYFTAPFLQYWNTSGSSTYTWSNSYGIYGTVQTPTFSNNTADSPTVTIKTPIWYARCSSTYFATGRVGDIDQTETTLKRTCKIYRVKKGTAPREIYEGLVDIINHPL